MLQANDPALQSWVEVDANSDFPIQNIPFGIMKVEGEAPRAATAIGNYVLDLGTLANEGFFEEQGIHPAIFNAHVLNDFLMLGKNTWRAVRQRISDLLNKNNAELRDKADLVERVLIPQSEVQMLLPVQIGDYTDFYASREHATNVGTMFRGPENALMPNWLHLPVGYHGRASSIVASGHPVRRPMGQTRPVDTEPPVFGPSKLLDIEMEVGFITGQGKMLGERISVEEADDYIFGLVLLNDWSARDIQKWEYVPLGPFLGKNFASSISPWIVTLDALQPFKLEPTAPEKELLPYLQHNGDYALDLNLKVQIEPENVEASTVCQTNFRYMYWTMQQQLAHHTVNGCNINAGDMLASGTISGPTPDSYGSLLELTWRGTKPLSMKDGSQRKFLQDGDSVIMSGYGEKDGVRIGFGELRSKILPAQ